MTIISCPECGHEISDKALMCPQCGFSPSGLPFSYEYRSKKTLFGLPLVHIVYGYAFNPITGRIRVAKGIIAIGPMAVGLVAIGGGALGYYSMGGGAFGAHPLGGNAQDPEAIEFFKQYLGPWVEQLKPPNR